MAGHLALELGCNMSINDQQRAGGEQPAFAHACALMRKLVQTNGLRSVDVGAGFLAAAIALLSASLPRHQLAEILYRHADEFAAPSPRP